MTKEELIKKLHDMRLLAFSDLAYHANASATTLAAAGHRGKSNAEAVLAQFTYHAKEIEKILKKWEKENH